MAGIDFRVVPMRVATNPVARAVARQRINAAVRDFSIQLHLLDDGEDVRHELSAAARVLAVAVRVAEQRAQTAGRPEDRSASAHEAREAWAHVEALG